MITELHALNLACDRRELQPRGTPLFPCEAYACDIGDYPAREIPPHWHPELELMRMDSGSARVVAAGASFVLHAGEGCFVNTNGLHSIACAQEGVCRCHSLVFDAAIVAGLPGAVFDTRYVRPLLAGEPRSLPLRPQTDGTAALVCSAFEDAFAACAGEAPGHEFAVRDALSRVVLALSGSAKAHPAARPAAAQELRVKQMLSWLDEHYAEPVTLAALAASVHICPRECQRDFARLLHLSPGEYLLRRRIAAAAQLLAATDLPVTEAALRSGFSSPSYFAKQFVAVIGASPRAYRAALRSAAGAAQ